MTEHSGWQHLSDEELVQISIENKDAFGNLIDRYSERLIFYVLRLSRISRQDAEDIVQDAFIKAYQNIRGFDQSLSFSSWIYRIVHNETISFYRRLRSRAHGNILDVEDDALMRISDDLNIENELDRSLLKSVVTEAIYQLPRKYRDVLILKYIEDKGYREISDILRKPEGTIGTLINRAKGKLRGKLRDYYQKNHE